MGRQGGIYLHISLIGIQPFSLQYMMKLHVNYNLFILMIWLKMMSRGHVVDIYIAWVENDNLKNCSLRVLNLGLVRLSGTHRG